MEKTLSKDRVCHPKEELIAVVQRHLPSFFGVDFREISEKEQERLKAKRRTSDARTAYIHAVYSAGIMDGAQLGEHLGITPRAVRYHLKKYNELRSGGVFGPLYDRFNEVTANDIAEWQREKPTN